MMVKKTLKPSMDGYTQATIMDTRIPSLERALHSLTRILGDYNNLWVNECGALVSAEVSAT